MTVSNVVPWVVTKTSLRVVSTSLNTDSGAFPPPHVPRSAEVPDVVPVKRPPGSITDTAPVSQSGLLQTAPSPVASLVGRSLGPVSGPPPRSGATSGGEIASGPPSLLPAPPPAPAPPSPAPPTPAPA